MKLHDLLNDESLRLREFPVAQQRVFFAHAGVTALPRVAVEAINAFTRAGSLDNQESSTVWPRVQRAREVAARLLGCGANEVALLGPTALGLSLVANGLDWRVGDEVVFYPDDYPANVYPWTHLAERGVCPVPLSPEQPGLITWEVVEKALTDNTRLVALASCHFLSGFRIDIDGIGRELQKRDILFCLDAIQSLGATPVSVEHVDFLSADSHKWLLGPVAAGVFYVKAARQPLLRPTLLGAWNITSPQFIAQEEIRFETGARRYEPGTLNLPGLLGMMASMEMILEIGIETIHERLLRLRALLVEATGPLGFSEYVDSGRSGDPTRSGILSLVHSEKDVRSVSKALDAENISVSAREDRNGTPILRLSPHFYNTEEEIDRVARALKKLLG